jgi:class 3 adenylate cyclase
MYPRFSDNKTYMDIGSAGATFRQDAAGATWMAVDSSDESDRRQVTVLFADVVGFTPMSAGMSPSELVGLLDDVFTRFDGFGV